jgi:hypothetical protein
MIYRSSYVGAVGLLLTLACGPRVEIGHGTGGGGAGGSIAGSGNKAGGGGNGDGEAGENAAGTVSGGTASSNGGSLNDGSEHVGGPIPSDNGPQREVTKIDLLLALDNSFSMAEKQQLFAKTMPELVKRLVSPRCVTAAGVVSAEPPTPELPCPAGSTREFEPLRDLHVGVITSSLGSHGAKGAKDVCVSPEDNDNAHLLGTVRPGIASYESQGYLKWDPDGTSSPPGEADVQAFADSLTQMLESAGETGCGYEAQLESVYRFLVDPEPPQRIVVPDGGSLAAKQGVDADLLEQRANFLRPDSSVVVVVLTDENDCSIVDEGYGWLVPRAAPMYRSTSACLADPNDACCQSCGEATAAPGCPSIAADPECQKGMTLDAQGEDDLNLRCWHQKQRFGFSLLYPLARYVGGFGGGTVRSRAGELVANPLFHRDGVDRDPSLFTLAVVGGVPWQDIATPASITGDTLQYLTAAELTAQKRWGMIAGDPERHVEPTDPFMRESVEPRLGGKNPITGEDIVAASSTNPTANSINGHEQVDVGSRDLQYACTFPLPEPIVCDQMRLDNDQGCDCFEDDLSYNRPSCQPPGGGEPTTTQYYGKAYPALRELAVASQLGRRSVLGSVCARNTQDEARSDYGYRPVLDALGRRIASTLVKP